MTHNPALVNSLQILFVVALVLVASLPSIFLKGTGPNALVLRAIPIQIVAYLVIPACFYAFNKKLRKYAWKETKTFFGLNNQVQDLPPQPARFWKNSYLLNEKVSSTKRSILTCNNLQIEKKMLVLMTSVGQSQWSSILDEIEDPNPIWDKPFWRSSSQIEKTACFHSSFCDQIIIWCCYKNDSKLFCALCWVCGGKETLPFSLNLWHFVKNHGRNQSLATIWSHLYHFSR